ncbi:MAG: hypothetical protein MIO92_14525, partial [Methanosarcinaceae archaeon]|nr:hypothetical protein [Methanosarcinaceae archaeon]
MIKKKSVAVETQHNLYDDSLNYYGEMMKNKLMKLLYVVMIGLLMVACKTDKNDVATLITEDTQRVEASTSDTSVLDNEAMMMAFTECLRENGVEVVDPVVDADGNVQKPELVEGMEW